MNEPLVSFIVPCYNYGQYLADCLKSIFVQEGDFHFEIIVINDASPDNTKEVVAQFSDPRLRVIHHEQNQGHLKSVTEGILAARGTYLARIDADDRYRPCFLREALGRFACHPDAGMIYGNVSIIDHAGNITQERTDSVHGGRDFCGNEYILLLSKNVICAPTLLAKRESWIQALPLPDGLVFNDWWFNLQMSRKLKVCYINDVLADYRVHGQNHHSALIIKKDEEPSIFRVLKILFEEREDDPELEVAKRAARHKVYAAQYLDQATKYFGVGYFRDARRCFLHAIGHQPACLLSLVILRHFVGSLLGGSTYAFIKSRLKAIKKTFSLIVI